MAETRTERIVVLLEWYNDVEQQGLRDQRGDGEHLPLMSRVWNHPSYKELDRLIGLMKDHEAALYEHLSQTFFYARERRVLQCPRCRGIIPTTRTDNFHKHGHSNVAIVPKVVSMVKIKDKETVYDRDRLTPEVQEAITWLDEQWGLMDVFLPDELMAA